MQILLKKADKFVRKHKLRVDKDTLYVICSDCNIRYLKKKVHTQM